MGFSSQQLWSSDARTACKNLPAGRESWRRLRTTWKEKGINYGKNHGKDQVTATLPQRQRQASPEKHLSRYEGPVSSHTGTVTAADSSSMFSQPLFTSAITQTLSRPQFDRQRSPHRSLFPWDSKRQVTHAGGQEAFSAVNRFVFCCKRSSEGESSYRGVLAGCRTGAGENSPHLEASFAGNRNLIALTGFLTANCSTDWRNRRDQSLPV